MVFVRSTFLKNLKTLHFSEEFVDVTAIQNDISLRSGIPTNLLSLFYNGKRTYSHQKIPQDSTVDVCFQLCGGKGGFGSMLRAIGAQIEKTTNREACRDLSGRRLRDINEEQRLKQWLSKKAEREAEQLKRRKEKLERLKQLPKHEFHDPEYNRERSELPERIDDALSEGLKKISKGKKSKRNMEPPSKKKRTWLDDEISSDSEASGENENHQSSGENSRSSQGVSSHSTDCDTSEISDAGTSGVINKWNDADTNTIKSNDDTAGTSGSQMDTSEHAEIIFRVDDQQAEAKSNTEKTPEVDSARSSTEDSFRQELPQCLKEQENEPTKEEMSHSVDGREPAIQLESKEAEQEDSLDLMKFQAPNELESLGLEKLKSGLMNMGLKCGGTLTERAQRLWTVRGLDPQDYPAALKAKKKK